MDYGIKRTATDVVTSNNYASTTNCAANCLINEKSQTQKKSFKYLLYYTRIDNKTKDEEGRTQIDSF